MAVDFVSTVTRRAWLTSAATVSVAGMATGLQGCITRVTSDGIGGGVQWVEAPHLVNSAPAAPREFRGAWVATVANIDWPSRRGLSTEAQQSEMRALLDKAVAIGLNAIILQVRTSADAMYASDLEPWSEYLTGVQGQAPSPFYDPLELWIAEAHQRGLELHAWFNPFRARLGDTKAEASASHVSRRRPEWVKAYGNQLWIDPGEQEAADHSLTVMMDVLRRYDVDAIHIDDYFYPYPVTQGGDSKTEVDFPDQPSWQRYRDTGGALNRDDWRRSNVDKLVARIYQNIRAIKPWVRFGISPFGLGRPELRPAGIQGFSQYHKLYADVERWMNEGWLDYLVPQLYWPIAQKEQAFGVLLDYWRSQNPRERHVWPGLFTSRVGELQSGARVPWLAAEIVEQIELVRQRSAQAGHAHFSMVALLQNRKSLADLLQGGLYASPALIPASPWLGQGVPETPLVQLERTQAGDWQLNLRHKAAKAQIAGQGRGARQVLQWPVWVRHGTQWSFQVVTQWPHLLPPAAQSDAMLPANAVIVSAVDRVGLESARVGWMLSDYL